MDQSRRKGARNGPGSAREVKALADQLMRDAGIVRTKANAVLAVEVVISLPSRMCANDLQFFDEAEEVGSGI